MLKQTLGNFALRIKKLVKFLSRPTDVRYTSTPVWKPWRDYFDFR
jgi:hypothetical protein